MTAQVSKEVGPHVNPNVSTMASRLRDFVRTSPPVYLGSKNSRAKMNQFMMGVSKLVENECRVAMLIDDMDISRLMIFSQRIEELKLKKESKEKKRSTLDDDEPLDDESDGHDRPKFRQKFPEQGPSSTSKFNQKRVSNPKSQEEGSEILLPGCLECDRSHEGECLACSNICFGCGDLGHKIRHCPKIARNEKDSRRRSQPYPSSGPLGLGGKAPRKNRS
ncbi:uncharacterized protein LOC125842904 [Solanum stenotomum]|uniref:uncharacterized protein LOC125842904 n=1 Tax=Solanum stenotomum TaxID=172797 RepID=UPI0020D041D4|nr:uncharacterized protein LOC125842904 [Solanum stenotomum]